MGANHQALMMVPTPFLPWTGAFDAVQHSSHISLSNANLTATQDGVVGYFVNAGVNPGKTTGKWKCSFHIDAIGSGVTVGVSILAYGGLDGAEMGDNTQMRGYASTGKKRDNAGSGGPGTAYGSSFTTGDIVKMFFDFEAGTVEFFKNDVSQGVAFTDVIGAGTWYACVSLNQNAAVTGIFT